jgi:hypothetical protein
MKEAALKRLDGPSLGPVRYKAPDRLLASSRRSDYARHRHPGIPVVRSFPGLDSA